MTTTEATDAPLLQVPPYDAAGVPWLSGIHAPVFDERDEPALRVSGRLPDGLRGAFLRNGPNPAFQPDYRYHLFDGDGMVHGLYLDGEGGARYANRWVRSAAFEEERKVGRSIYGGLAEFRMPPPEVFAVAGPVKNTANTHIVRHAGHLLALMEGVGPTELASDLSTVGPFDFDGRLVGSMTAHPKLDPETGELVFFGYSPMAPYLRVHTASPTGELTWSTEVELPGPVMMHDFVATRNHVIIFDLPAVFDLHALLAGDTAVYWDPARGARIGVLERGAPGDSVRWIEVDPFWVFHFVNGHEASDGTFEVTGCRASRLNTSFDDTPGLVADTRPVLHRWRIDPVAGTVVDEPLGDEPTDFPRIDDRRAGLANRWAYSAHAPVWNEDEAVFDGVFRHDLENGTAEVHRYGPDQVCGETVHAPDPASDAEGSGWLLNFVHDRSADESSVVVLDAATLDEVARVHLPRRVPFGFHGSFVADLA